MKKIAILGITGSIGTSAVEVIREHSNQFQIVFATAHNNFKTLLKYCEEFKISTACITNLELKNLVDDIPKNLHLYFGEDELQKILNSLNCDVVIKAISGSAGLRSSVTTISNEIDLALANKESLVMAGHILMDKTSNSKANVFPVDSEHSAILQALGNSCIEEIKSIILTASGGPFRRLPLNKFKDITLKQTLKHPTWKMGAKITIDSATMMNKALEVIEAHWLFGINFPKIKTVIHPQSIIHSFVEFADNSIISQMSFPTMKIPILYALTHPKHIKSNISKTNILELPALTFEEVQKDRYPLFFFAYEIGKKGGILPTILNAVNEASVQLFIDGKIEFLDIFTIVKKIVSNATNSISPTIEEIIYTNQKFYKKTKQDYKKFITF